MTVKGRVVSLSHVGGLLAEFEDKAPGLGWEVRIEGGRTIGRVDSVIGGIENVGNGWKMLMECLSAGRGISFPATANASSKVATFGIMNYIKVRDQFKMPIGKMEAIQEKLNAMVYNTWIIQSSIELMNDISI